MSSFAPAPVLPSAGTAGVCFNLSAACDAFEARRVAAGGEALDVWRGGEVALALETPKKDQAASVECRLDGD